jgi:thioesterase domain-containing protein
MANTYVAAIKEIQPEGPYAVAGYSLGSSVAFEIAKQLETKGDKVPFLGILDSPPHIPKLIGQQDFIDVLLNVAYFLELITEQYAMVETIPMHEKSIDQALDIVLSCAPPDRLQVLSIDKARLHKITEVTLSFGKAGKYYEPEGAVSAMDIFWVTPLLWVAKDREEWMDLHLSKWVDFSEEPPKFRECEGVHSKMLNANFVDGVAKKLRAVMQARGI